MAYAALSVAVGAPLDLRAAAWRRSSLPGFGLPEPSGSGGSASHISRSSRRSAAFRPGSTRWTVNSTSAPTALCVEPVAAEQL